MSGPEYDQSQDHVMSASDFNEMVGEINKLQKENKQYKKVLEKCKETAEAVMNRSDIETNGFAWLMLSKGIVCQVNLAIKGND